MMWLALAFLSAALLGCYDFFKKVSLKDNPVVTVLFLNTLFSALLFAPFILLSRGGAITEGALFVPELSVEEHLLLLLKAVIVLSSWLYGYIGLKQLPITIVAPIQSMRPVLVLIGAVLLFGEVLNVYQWIGIVIAIISVFYLSESVQSEGIVFGKNPWVTFIALSAIFGAASALYDKYLMRSFEPIAVQSWFNLYQCVLMAVLAFVFRIFAPERRRGKFHWRWSIPMISLFLAFADFCYFSSLAQEGALIAVVSMVRRGSVVVSFLFGALLLREKNIAAKAVDVVLIIIGLFFLYLGSR